MRWNPGHRSVNVEDRRGAGGGFMRGAGGMGAGGLVILVILSLIFGRDFVSLASDPGVAQPGAESAEVPPAETTPEEERLVSLVSFVLDDAQDTWRQVSSEMGTPYRDAKLVLFRDAMQSACGFAEAATGPFYCPGGREGVHRPRLLRGAAAAFRRAGRLRAGLRAGARDRPSRAEPARHRGAGARGAAAGAPTWPTSSRCGSSSRPTATPACGDTARRSARCWSQATWRKGSRRPRRSGTTGSSAWVEAGWSRSRSPTAPRRSAVSGSSAASSAGDPDACDTFKQ